MGRCPDSIGLLMSFALNRATQGHERDQVSYFGEKVKTGVSKTAIKKEF